MNPIERPGERDEVSPELRGPRTTLKPTPSKSDEPTDTLETSADRYRLLVQSIQDYAIFILNPAGYIVTWNEGARRLKGYQESEIVGKHFSILYPPEDVANRVPQQLLSFAARDGRVEQEGWRLRKDGTRFWADVVITALRDGEGNLVGFGKVTRDVTDRRKAEEALAQSEERFRLLVDSVEDYAIYMLDTAGHVISWNPGAERFKGYREAEILGKHFSVFYSPEDRAQGKPARGLEIAAREGHYEDVGWRMRKDGTRFWADVVITPLRDSKGRLVGFGKVTRDLTERKLAEEAMRQSEERVREMIECIQDYAIFMLDPTGHIMTWNSGAERLKGYRESEIVGRHLSTFYLPEDAASALPERLLRRAAEEGRTAHEGWRVRKDGTRFWADVVITALHNHNGDLIGFVKVTRDLTERRRATEERIRLAQERAARQAAEESVRVRDEFLGVAAHELKTPVTSLLLQTQLVARRLNRDGTLDAATAARALSMVEEQSRKLSSLVNKLLDISRVANGRLAIDRQTVDLVSLIGSAVERSRLLAPTREVHLVAPESLPAEVDSMRLEQVITNLLDNAVKYSTDGAIEVTVSRQDSGCVRIAVRDHGPGVPIDKRTNLFAQFYQVEAHNYSGGMGLGLYISKQIAQLHGGDLVAEFPPDGGSEFIVTLPVGAETARSDRP